MSIFEDVIPFPQRLQWLMLKSALDGDLSADIIAKRLEWSLSKVYQCVWGNPGRLRIETVGEWFFACGGRMPEFKLVSRKSR